MNFHHPLALAGRQCLASTLLVALASAQQGSELDATTLDSIRAQLKTLEYEFTSADDGSSSAPNRAQGLRARVSANGLEVWPRGLDSETSDWSVRLRTLGLGRGEDLSPVNLQGQSADGARVELDFGPMTEWFVNGERGIEQGWTLDERPAGEAGVPLHIELAFESDLALRIDDGRRSATFVNGQGDVQARYTGLLAWDRHGRDLDARLLSSPRGIRIEVDDSRAVYPVTVDPLITGPVWTYEGSQCPAQFGLAVDYAGDVDGGGYSDLRVGAPFDSSVGTRHGRAYLYLGSASGPAADYEERFMSPFSFDFTGHATADAEKVNQGYALGSLGNAGGGSWYAGLRQVNVDGSSSVARLGVPSERGAIRFEASVNSWLASFEHWAPGDIQVFLEWEAKSLHVPFDGTGIERSPVGVASGALGIPQVIAGVASELAPGKPTHYRMRFALVGSPLLAHTPWVSLAGDALTETKFRTQPLETTGIGGTPGGGIPSGGGGTLQGP